MAGDVLLWIDGINGEAQDSEYNDCINVISWHWGLNNPGSQGELEGGSTGKVSAQDVSVTIPCDSSLPQLLQACAIHSNADKHATLVFRKTMGDADTTKEIYMELDLYKTVISDVQVGGSGDSSGQTVTININFSRYKFTYLAQTDAGIMDAERVSNFDLEHGHVNSPEGYDPVEPA